MDHRLRKDVGFLEVQGEFIPLHIQHIQAKKDLFSKVYNVILTVCCKGSASL